MSTFKQDLKQARSAIVFLIGLTLAFGLVFTLEKWKPQVGLVRSGTLLGVGNYDLPVREPRKLKENELQWAKTAWQYFEKNYQPETGMVNSVDKYPASTMWDTSSYLLGLISAYRLSIVDEEEFDVRTSGLLETLATMPLFEDQLPNKSYNTITKAMVTYENEETERGIGWSAIDIGRIMVPLNVLVWHYPQYTEQVTAVVNHWDIDLIIRDSEMYGTDINDLGETIFLQEGRLGYEEYASKSLVLVGKDLSEALSYEQNMDIVDIYDIPVATDARDPERFGALNYVVSEPYVLDGLEFGWDRFSKELASRIFRVQKARYESTGILTAVSEDNIDESPYFVYNTVFADGKAWNAITETGEDASEFRSVSTKAAFGFYALFGDEYSELLIDHLKDNYDPERGWYSGIYEATGESNTAITANTNGIILEAIHFIENGPMMTFESRLMASADMESENSTQGTGDTGGNDDEAVESSEASASIGPNVPRVNLHAEEFANIVVAEPVDVFNGIEGWVADDFLNAELNSE